MKKRLSIFWFFTVELLVIAAVLASAQEPAGPIERALTDSSWESVEAESVTVFFKPGSFAERHRHMLLRSAQVALSEVVECLGEAEYDRELRLIYVDSREEMNELAGRPATGLAVWTENGVFLVVNPQWRSFEKHEITHVVTMGVWGPPDPTSQWMIEGISISCDGWCREYSIDEIAYHLLSHGELPPLPELFDNFRSLGEVRGGVYAASIIDFIRTTYGTDAVRKLWTEGTGDRIGSAAAKIEEVDALWKEHLERTVGDVDVDYDVIKENGCG